jgi:hypothetical protein
MKDAGYILRQKYFERLNGNVTDNGLNVPIYDSVSVDANVEQPYICLSTYSATEIGEGTKESFGQETFLNVEVVCKVDNSFGGKTQADNIYNQVVELIRTRQSGYLDLSPNFQVITILQDNTTTIEEIVQTGLINRRITRFRHKIIQL